MTDGDPDVALCTKLFFPNVIHTLDVIHVVDRLRSAGMCLYDAGSHEPEQWRRTFCTVAASELRRRRRRWVEGADPFGSQTP